MASGSGGSAGASNSAEQERPAKARRMEGRRTSPGVLARIRGIAVPLLMWQTALLWCTLWLLPAVPLLAVPGRFARGAFVWWAGQAQVAWLGFAVALLRGGLGIRIFLHSRDGVLESLAADSDALLLANHRTRLDWMFLWAFAAHAGRLRGLKVVLKDSLKMIPGFGWATQCFGYAFMRRRDRAGDLETLRLAGRSGRHSGAAGAAGGPPLALLLFPEGTDLSESNVEKDKAFALKAGLPDYEQVLHPRTAGFAAAWSALCSSTAKPPLLVDLTVAYVDYAPGERPSEKSVFLEGRPCREVHILAEKVEAPALLGAAGDKEDEEAAEGLVRKLFEAKDAVLRPFYAPMKTAAVSPAGEPQSQDPRQLWSFKAGTTSVAVESSSGARRAMAWGILTTLAMEAAMFALVRRAGLTRSVCCMAAVCCAWEGLRRMTGGLDRVVLRGCDGNKRSD